MSADALAGARRLLIDAADEPPAARLYARWFHEDSGALREYPGGTAYHAATLDPDRFEGGWTALAPLADVTAGVTVERAGERREVWPPGCAPATRGRLRLDAGDELLVDPLGGGVAGGFWHLWSAGWRRRVPEHLQRLYLALAPGREIEAARRFARLADPADTWSVKFLTGLHRAGRRDPAVLYLDLSRPLASGWVGALEETLAGLLDGEPPPFTRQIGHGLAWAEDPGGGLSFGEHLCRLLAEAAKAPRALDDERSWRGAVAREFRSAGLDLASPEICAAGRGRDGA